MALKKSQKSLKKWTKQNWRTKSGKPSTQGPKATGERYLPEKAIKSLSAKEYAATNVVRDGEVMTEYNYPAYLQTKNRTSHFHCPNHAQDNALKVCPCEPQG